MNWKSMGYDNLELTPDGHLFLSFFPERWCKISFHIEDKINNVVNDAAADHLGKIQNKKSRLTFELTPGGHLFLSFIRSRSKISLYIEDIINDVLNLAAADEHLGNIEDAVKIAAVGTENHILEECKEQRESTDEGGRENEMDSGDSDSELSEFDSEQPFIELSPDGRRFLSFIQSKSEYSYRVEDEINKAVNIVAEDYLHCIQGGITNLVFGTCFDDDCSYECKQEWERVKKLGLEADFDDETKVEAAISIFPEVLSQRNSPCDVTGIHPVMWRAKWWGHGTGSLKSVSLIPLLVELGTKFGVFDEGMRGGLLSTDYDGINVLNHICFENVSSRNSKQYKEDTEDCYLDVIKILREKKYFVKEDIREFNIVGRVLLLNNPTFAEKRFQYLVDWDPMSLSMPCDPESGNWLPIHWSTQGDVDIGRFRSVLEAGLKHFPTELGFSFCTGDSDSGYDSDDADTRTPFQLACEKFGREAVIEVVAACIAACPTIRTESFLMAIAIDNAIHLDCLYLLLRKDPTAVSRLVSVEVYGQRQQKRRRH